MCEARDSWVISWSAARLWGIRLKACIGRGRVFMKGGEGLVSTDTIGFEVKLPQAKEYDFKHFKTRAWGGTNWSCQLSTQRSLLPLLKVLNFQERFGLRGLSFLAHCSMWHLLFCTIVRGGRLGCKRDQRTDQKVLWSNSHSSQGDSLFSEMHLYVTLEVRRR